MGEHVKSVDIPVWSVEISHEAPLTVSLTGELDLTCANEVLDTLMTQLEDTGGPLLVDLSAVTFMDSTALAALVQVHNRAESIRRTFGIVNPSRAADRVLQLAGVRDVFTTPAPGSVSSGMTEHPSLPGLTRGGAELGLVVFVNDRGANGLQLRPSGVKPAAMSGCRPSLVTVNSSSTTSCTFSPA